MFRFITFHFLIIFTISCSRPEKKVENNIPQKFQEPEKPKNSFQKNPSGFGPIEPIPESYPEEQINAGKILANTYCQMCHMLPDPTWLDKKTWHQSVLPNMSVRLGRFAVNDTTLDYIPDEWYEKGEGGERVRQQKVFPQNPLLSHDEWKKIVAYYVGNAPNKVIPQEKHEKLLLGLKYFNIEVIRASSQLTPDLSLLKINENTNEIFIGDAAKNTLKIFDSALHIKSTIQLNGPPVDIRFFQQFYFVTNIGSIPASDNYKGEVVLIHPKPNNIFDLSLILNKLPRPVSLSLADLNQDGNMDFVVCGFGNWTGGLTWHEKENGPQLKLHDLKKTPGFVKTYIRDFNNDKLADIISLKANDDEGIYLFINQGNGNFLEQCAVRFPPSYGCNYFELVDFDKDGLEDILMTNGDNADYKPILKKYHGIRILKNYGNLKYKEIYFYPMYGAVKATAHDFDIDGDLDIAAIATFPDLEEKNIEGFTLLENISGYIFKPSTFAEAGIARWLVMDTGDIDNDGDKDIIIGAHNMPADVPENVLQEWKNNSTPLIILRNKIK